MKTVMVKGGAGMPHEKRAMMTAATNMDRHYIKDQWFSFRDWRHDIQVEQVKHFNRHVTQVGDVVAVRDTDSQEIVTQVQIAEIRMVETSMLAEAQVKELGFSSRDDLVKAYGDRRMWYMQVLPAPVHEQLQ